MFKGPCSKKGTGIIRTVSFLIIIFDNIAYYYSIIYKDIYNVEYMKDFMSGVIFSLINICLVIVYIYNKSILPYEKLLKSYEKTLEVSYNTNINEIENLKSEKKVTFDYIDNIEKNQSKKIAMGLKTACMLPLPIVLSILMILLFIVCCNLTLILTNFFTAEKYGILKAFILNSYWSNSGMEMFFVYGGIMFVTIQIIIYFSVKQRSTADGKSNYKAYNFCKRSVFASIAIFYLFFVITFIKQENPNVLASNYENSLKNIEDNKFIEYNGLIYYNGIAEYYKSDFRSYKFLTEDGLELYCLYDMFIGEASYGGITYKVEYLEDTNIIVSIQDMNGAMLTTDDIDMSKSIKGGKYNK